MVAMTPTRGLDVGAIEGVHRLLLELRRTGTGVLLVSEELDEIMALSDRIAVIYEGQIVGVLEGEIGEEDRDRLGLMMTGEWKGVRPASVPAETRPGSSSHDSV